MLIRATTRPDWECITQEHHAVLSGALAAEWLCASSDATTSSEPLPQGTPRHKTRLPGLWIQAIGLHDSPWRQADAQPAFSAEEGLPVDFVHFPMEQRLKLYAAGIDALERVDPWVACLVSRHYTRFAGMRQEIAFAQAESQRRRRLRSRLRPRDLEREDEALQWLQFFDVLSLYLCLSGPMADQDAIPRWLKNPSTWSATPDGQDLELTWLDEYTLRIAPWPLASSEWNWHLAVRHLKARAPDASTMRSALKDATWEIRALRCIP